MYSRATGSSLARRHFGFSLNKGEREALIMIIISIDLFQLIRKGFDLLFFFGGGEGGIF